MNHKPKTDRDYALIYSALDELMICKGRPVLEKEHKKIWIKQLSEQRMDAILWAIQDTISTIGPFPEIATLIAGCSEHKNVCREIYAAEAEERFKSDLLRPQLEDKTPKKEIILENDVLGLTRTGPLKESANAKS